MQANYFTTNTNNARSFAQKLEIIKLIAFLTQVMNKKDKEKYPDALSVLGAIFGVNLSDIGDEKHYTSFDVKCVRSFALLVDDLLWETIDEISKPEGINNAKEIKDKIITYFTDEWAPF